MDPRSHAEMLLQELLHFSREAKFAVEQENWEYLQEVLRKKGDHLIELQVLTADGSIKGMGLGPLAEELQKAEVAACNALALKLDEARQKQEALESTKVRVSGVKRLVKTEPEESWVATA